MKKKITILILVFVFAIGLYSTASAKTRVRSYTKSNGTHVTSHYRTDKDNRFNNNWSTKGNHNPYTGKAGYKTKK